MDCQNTSKEVMTITKIDTRCVSMANELLQAAHGLNLAKKRIMSIAASNIKSIKPKLGIVYDPRPFMFEVTAEEYSRVCGIDIKSSYRQLRAASLDLMNDHIERKVYDKQGNPIIIKGKQQIERFVWVQHVKYCEGGGRVEITFSQRVTDFLTGLNKNFTRYLLVQGCRLSSYYAFRFFEIIMQYKNTGWFYVKVDEFCDMMNAPASYRKHFQMVKTRLIQPAIEQLKNDWQVNYETECKMRGKRITHIKFNFKESDKDTETTKMN